MTTAQFRVLTVEGGTRKTLADDATLRSFGIYCPEEERFPELLCQMDVDCRVGGDSTGLVALNSIVMDGVQIDLTLNRIPYAGHNFQYGEAVQFSGASRPQIASVAIAATTFFYVKPVDADTIEVYTTRDLTTICDFNVQGTVWSIDRYNYFYTESRGLTASGVLMNTIGAPQETGKRYPVSNLFWDFGFDVPPNALVGGGALHGELTGLIWNASGGALTATLVLDPNGNVRAHGISSAGIGVAAPSAGVCTIVAHGLKTREIVQLVHNGAQTFGATVGENLYVKWLSADTFSLHTSAALTAATLKSFTSGHIFRTPIGGPNKIRFSASIPDDMGVVQTISVTGATWTNATLRLTKTGAFVDYPWRTVDKVYVSAGTGATAGWYGVAGVDASGNYITLTATIGAGANGQTDIAAQLHAIEPVMFTWRWSFKKDAANQATDNITEAGIWTAELVLPTNGYTTDPGTAGTVLRQAFSKTRPQGANFAEILRHEWGPCGRIRHYTAGATGGVWPTVRYAAGATLTGATSGATGYVVEHDMNAQTIVYHKLQPDKDFMAGETVTNGTTTLVIGPVERAPMPTRISTRISLATLAAAYGSAEMHAHHYEVMLHRQRLN